MNKLVYLMKLLAVPRSLDVAGLGVHVSLLFSQYWKSLSKNRGLEKF